MVLHCLLETGNVKLETGLGAVAQLGERLVCNQEATGSIPVSSTRMCSAGTLARELSTEVDCGRRTWF